MILEISCAFFHVFSETCLGRMLCLISSISDNNPRDGNLLLFVAFERISKYLFRIYLC